MALARERERERVCVCVCVLPFISDRQIDIMFIQETWFRQTGDEGKFSDITPSGYSVCSLPRSNRGGGLAIIYRDSLSRYLGFVTDFAFSHSSFEVVHLTLSVPQQNIHLICIYRTFPSKKNKLTDAMFHQEFPELLDYGNTLSGTYVVLGDINFHFDQPQHPSTAKMIELLDQFSLSQSVTEPTHNRGHIIDWIMHRPQDGVVRSTLVTQELTSDHFCVVCDLSVAAPPPPPMFMEVRSLRTVLRLILDYFPLSIISCVACLLFVIVFYFRNEKSSINGLQLHNGVLAVHIRSMHAVKTWCQK